MANAAGLLSNPEHPDVIELSKLFRQTTQQPQQDRKKKRRLKAKLQFETDPFESAKEAGLRYVSDSGPGISRKRRGKGFAYTDANGQPVKDTPTLDRIRKLAIPPAWTNVWISPKTQSHLQATGRDAKGRKQYRYHLKWIETRDSTKFDRMLAFGHVVPTIREKVDQDLSLPGLPKEKVLATIVRLLEVTLIRVGNEEYARDNQSYGLTTLRNKHVEVLGSSIRFRFKGKSGKEHDVGIREPKVARILKRCLEIPGYELFQYMDENGQPASIDSSDVNAYLKQITNDDFTAKDFRTWAATVLATMALHLSHSEDAPATKKKVNEAIQMVANLLGNTPSICRKCYIHPEILDGYLRGDLITETKLDPAKKSASIVDGLAPEESAVLEYLRKRVA